MAKSSNTWQKKLMAKQVKFAQRHARPRFAKTFELQGLKEDKPKERDFVAPVRDGFVARGFGKGRTRNGCKMSAEKRAMVEAKASRRAAFFADIGASR